MQMLCRQHRFTLYLNPAYRVEALAKVDYSGIRMSSSVGQSIRVETPIMQHEHLHGGTIASHLPDIT